MSTRQLARTVIDGRQVRFVATAGADDIYGYLAGQDDYHWLVIMPDTKTALVHKGSTPQILLGEATYRDEPNFDELEKVVGPFRGFIERTMFGRESNDDDAPTQDGVGLGGA